jgi:hypothetical protein
MNNNQSSSVWSRYWTDKQHGNPFKRLLDLLLRCVAFDRMTCRGAIRVCERLLDGMATNPVICEAGCGNAILGRALQRRTRTYGGLIVIDISKTVLDAISAPGVTR